MRGRIFYISCWFRLFYCLFFVRFLFVLCGQSLVLRRTHTEHRQCSAAQRDSKGGEASRLERHNGLETRRHTHLCVCSRLFSLRRWVGDRQCNCNWRQISTGTTPTALDTDYSSHPMASYLSHRTSVRQRCPLRVVDLSSSNHVGVSCTSPLNLNDSPSPSLSLSPNSPSPYAQAFAAMQSNGNGNGVIVSGVGVAGRRRASDQATLILTDQPPPPPTHAHQSTIQAIRPSSSPRLYLNNATTPSAAVASLSKSVDSMILQVGRGSSNSSNGGSMRPPLPSTNNNTTTTSSANPSHSSSTVYYASSNTFRGEDVAHSSNSTFNARLVEIKQRLRDQRRNAINNLAASSSSSAAMFQGRDDISALSISGSSPPLDNGFHGRTSLNTFTRPSSSSAPSATPLYSSNATTTTTTTTNASHMSLPPFVNGNGMSSRQGVYRPPYSSSAHSKDSTSSTSSSSRPTQASHPYSVPHTRRSIFTRSDSSDEDSETERNANTNVVHRVRRLATVSAGMVRTTGIASSTHAASPSPSPSSASSTSTVLPIRSSSALDRPTISTSTSASLPASAAASTTTTNNNGHTSTPSTLTNSDSIGPSLSSSTTTPSVATPTHGGITIPPYAHQQILPVRATGDLLRQRAAAAAAAKELAAAGHPPSSSSSSSGVGVHHRRGSSSVPIVAVPKKSLYLSPQSGTHFAMSQCRPHHIAAVPTYLEPFSVTTDRMGLMKRLRTSDEAKLVRQHLLGCTIVYDSIDPNPDLEELKSSLSYDQLRRWQSPTTSEGTSLPYYYIPHSSEDTTLIFESRFEGGNLRRAIQVDTYEYDLLIRPDINTNTYAQWFYFAIRNTRAAYQNQNNGNTNNNNHNNNNATNGQQQQQPIVYKFNIGTNDY